MQKRFCKVYDQKCKEQQLIQMFYKITSFNQIYMSFFNMIDTITLHHFLVEIE